MIGERWNLYGPLGLVGILLTAFLWSRHARRGSGHDGRLTVIYFAGLIGALVGAKVAFLLAEGWAFRNDWLALVTGRSVTGALLGGYAAVEFAKKKIGYHSVTGDIFALLVPMALMLGRVGCVSAGCCPGEVCESHWWTVVDTAGVARWPAAQVELIFNGLFLLWALMATRCHWLIGNRFHVYLIGYGLFRFGHEFARDDATFIGPIGGYHILALAIAMFGLLRFVQRRTEMKTPVGVLAAP